MTLQEAVSFQRDAYRRTCRFPRGGAQNAEAEADFAEATNFIDDLCIALPGVARRLPVPPRIARRLNDLRNGNTD